MQGHTTKKETETHSTMPPFSQIPPSSSSFLHPSTIAEATANTTSRKRVKRTSHSNCGSVNMERERRSKMTQMFTQLQTSVPGLLPQATREVIINETIGYIKELEKKKQRLEELKKLKETMKGLVTQILKVFCNHQAEILAANVTVNNGKLILAITALVQNNGNCVVEKIKREIMGL
ncbi:uncharacterized protein LOC128194994 isoform X2 [Vigna angularis]|uniref:uncharacterized protein LOC128194994 isoform X2 n=1 Tax=Phaseolus angularis TaxID=3914 RepID=UPI0022B4251E|nr:uncharacterized protein LOC128194994 isoform X2 [Vigna angularis]